MFLNRQQEPLTNDQLIVAAPSIFATNPWRKMSERYSFIPTITVVEEMRKNGFFPFDAKQSRTRIEGKSDFTKHQIRFRNMNTNVNRVGDTFAELILTNSHDGASAYDIMLGLFRLACLNGMCVSDAELASIHVRHTGDVLPVIEASFSLADGIPRVLQTVEDWKATSINPAQSLLLAEHALSLRYGRDDNNNILSPIQPEALLTTRRYADTQEKNNLFGVFNIVQENLTQGGLRGRSASGRRTRTRKVTGIGEDTRLNKEIFALTAAMKTLL